MKGRKTKSLHSKFLKSGKYNLFDFIYITFQVTPIFSFIYIIDKLIKAVIPALQVLVTASFIDKAVKIFEGKLDIRDLYISLLFLILIITFQYIDSVFMNIIKSKLSIKLNEIFKTIIIEKQARIEYKHIENTNSWDLVSRVCDRPVERILSGFQNILEGFELYIRVLAILLVLLVNVWWTAIIIIAFSVPLFYIAVKSGQTNYEAFKEAKKYERRSNYLHSIITDRDSVDERSLFSYTKAVNDLWYQENEKSRITKLKAELKNFIKMKSASLVTLLISLLISAVLILPLSKGLITTGLFIALIKEVFNLVQTMSWELSDVTEELANNIEYMKDLAAFSGLSETQMVLDIPDKTVLREEFSSLEFKDVSFKYPDTENYIIKHLSMKFEAKHTYAFVGINGAGKTTITKILTGLYDSYEGEIFINDENIRNFTFPQIKALFSVVYQDFARYYISIKENIMLGQIEGISEEDIYKVLDKMELMNVVNKYDKGIYTSLGKVRENSVDFSGGQWQRLAIARSLMSDAPIRILDEPTAALDPVAESNVYRIFSGISSEKTTILITHRLGAARIADEILLIDGGKVIERGSHEKLMKLGGKYAEMYESQRSWYN